MVCALSVPLGHHNSMFSLSMPSPVIQSVRCDRSLLLANNGVQ